MTSSARSLRRASNASSCFSDAYGSSAHRSTCAPCRGRSTLSHPLRPRAAPTPREQGSPWSWPAAPSLSHLRASAITASTGSERTRTRTRARSSLSRCGARPWPSSAPRSRVAGSLAVQDYLNYKQNEPRRRARPFRAIDGKNADAFASFSRRTACFASPMRRPWSGRTRCASPSRGSSVPSPARAHAAAHLERRRRRRSAGVGAVHAARRQAVGVSLVNVFKMKW